MTAPQDGIRCVITGCGHSGTRWLAEVLGRAGLPTAHEYKFNASVNDGRFRHVCEVSWTAAAWPQELMGRTVFMVVRDPLSIIRSFERQLWFDHVRANGTGHFALVRRHIGGNADAIDYVLGWWAMCESVAEWWWRIEDTSEYHIVRVFAACNVTPDIDRIREALRSVPRDRGTTRKPNVPEPDLSWMAAHPRYAELRNVAYLYGYDLPDREELLEQQKTTNAMTTEERSHA